MTKVVSGGAGRRYGFGPGGARVCLIKAFISSAVLFGAKRGVSSLFDIDSSLLVFVREEYGRPQGRCFRKRSTLVVVAGVHSDTRRDRRAARAGDGSPKCSANVPVSQTVQNACCGDVLLVLLLAILATSTIDIDQSDHLLVAIFVGTHGLQNNNTGSMEVGMTKRWSQKSPPFLRGHDRGRGCRTIHMNYVDVINNMKERVWG